MEDDITKKDSKVSAIVLIPIAIKTIAYEKGSDPFCSKETESCFLFLASYW